ncbi:MAG: hypothetical protein ABIK09_03630 [Pseudomonadota bacterium]
MHDHRGAAGPADGMPHSMALSVPWNHDPELLDRLEPFAYRMENIYLPFHPSVAGTSRAWAGPDSVTTYQAEVDRVAAWTASRDIGLVMVANLVNRPIERDALVEEVRRVSGKAGRLRLTFVDAVAASRLRERLAPYADIGVSVQAHVTNAVQALYWKEVAGASFVTVAREINRRPAPLEDIKSLGLRTGMVTCDECIPFCPFFSHHLDPAANHGFVIGRCSPESVGFLASRPWLVAQKEILPGHLRHLDGLVDEVKIPGRDQPTDKVVRLVEVYLEATSLVHPAGYYDEPPEMWDVLARCDRRCHACQYCADTIRRHKDEAQTRSKKLGQRDVRPADAAPEAGLGGPPGTPDSPWRFRDSLGRRAEVWLEPVGDHHALREVRGFAVYYRCPAGDLPGVKELVVAVGDAMEAGVSAAAWDNLDPWGEEGQTIPEVSLPLDGWPEGIILEEPH